MTRDDEVERFLHALAPWVARRLAAENRTAHCVRFLNKNLHFRISRLLSLTFSLTFVLYVKQVRLNLKVKHPDVTGEPSKFMGHGWCVPRTATRGKAQLPRPVATASEIARIAINMYRELRRNGGGGPVRFFPQKIISISSDY